MGFGITRFHFDDDDEIAPEFHVGLDNFNSLSADQIEHINEVSAQIDTVNSHINTVNYTPIFRSANQIESAGSYSQ